MNQNSNTEKSSRHNRKFLATLLGGTVISIVLIFSYFIIEAGYINDRPGNFTDVVIVSFATPIISALSIFAFAYTKKCPSCHALWAKVEDTAKTEELSRKKGYRTRSETKEIKNSSGDVIGRTENSYQARVLISKHRLYYHCKFCNHIWTKDIEVEDDEFDED